MEFRVTMQNPKKTRTFIFYENVDGKKVDAIELITKNSLKKVNQLFPIQGQLNRFADYDIILIIEQIVNKHGDEKWQ